MDIVVFVGVAVLILGLATPILVIYQTRFSQAALLRRRVQAIAPGGRTEEGGDSGARARQKLIQGKLKEMEKQRSKRRQTLTHLLLQAGLTTSVPSYIGICVGAGFGCGILGLIFGLDGLALLAMAVGGGFMVPRFVVNSIIKRRQGRFTEHFAGALDILVRGARTGLPVGECLRIVGREVPDPVGFEFRMLVESQRIGMTTEQALERGLERMPTSDFQFFAVVLVIQQQTGGNLAATLENLSNVLRSRKRLKDRIQAMSSEAKASAMIIGSLPFIVGTLLSVLNPSYIGLLFNTPMGHTLIGGGLFWMGLGVMVMRQMINFEV
ncbi:MAG: type II secretion system F family protein [Rhodospirillaceae bacterium]